MQATLFCYINATPPKVSCPIKEIRDKKKATGDGGVPGDVLELTTQLINSIY